jgi:CDP-diacylglycerol--glycerol-3-phosphate 3-phosphatidyltransferase
MSLIPRPIRQGFEALLTPLVANLTRAGVSPNALTTVGTTILVGAGVAFGIAQVRIGGLLLLVSGVIDMLDGRVAREGNIVTKFGAFYDSTLDRIGESALFAGIAVFFVAGGVPQGWVVPALLATLVALVAGLTVSYARARAEGLGLECKVGIVQRAERILGLGVPSLVFSAGPQGFLLAAVVAVLAVLSVVTVVQRVVHVHRITRTVRRPTQARTLTPFAADMSSRKGRSGD